VFREPGPCAACGVSIVSILSTDNKTPHSNVKCPFRQLSLHSVRSLHNVHSSVALPLARRSHALRCLSGDVLLLETYWTVDSLDTGRESGPTESGLEAVWTGRVEKIDVLCGLCGRSSPSSHIGHGTIMRPALSALAGGAAGGALSHHTCQSCLVQSLSITS
jgi:hypothetical protein